MSIFKLTIAFATSALLTACSGDNVTSGSQNLQSCFDTGTEMVCIDTPNGILRDDTDVNNDGILDIFMCAEADSNSDSDSDGISSDSDDPSSTSDSNGISGEGSDSTDDSDSGSDEDGDGDSDSSDSGEDSSSQSDSDSDDDDDGVQDVEDCDNLTEQEPV